MLAIISEISMPGMLVRDENFALEGVVWKSDASIKVATILYVVPRSIGRRSVPFFFLVTYFEW